MIFFLSKIKLVFLVNLVKSSHDLNQLIANYILTQY